MSRSSPSGAADHRVRLLGDAVDDAVAGFDLVHLAVLPRQTGAGEHEEDLLLVELDMDRRRLLARVHPRACNTDVLRAGRGSEVVAGEAERALVDRLGFDLVPVRDHVDDRTRLTSGVDLSKRLWKLRAHLANSSVCRR